MNIDEWSKEYSTPNKYGKAILAPSGNTGAFDRNAVDCPFVFRHRGTFHMLYVGFDGMGYQTALARSDDLFHWEHEALLFKRHDRNGWDSAGVAATWIIKEDELGEPPLLRKIDGKYWMAYHSYPDAGYEAGPAEIGIAWSTDDELRVWHRLEKPVLSWRDADDWEYGGLYKACIVEEDGLFYLFYNAKNPGVWPWKEQIGVAVSNDLQNWKRLPENPVVRVNEGSWDSRFAADPFVVKDRGRWVMFYYGYDGVHAQEGLAFSDDLRTWMKAPSPVIRFGSTGELDALHAHKPSVLSWEGKLHHFYCAVRPSSAEDCSRNEDPTGAIQTEHRCIAVASSR